MTISGTEVPTAVIVLGIVAVIAMLMVLVDLARHDVRNLPKWAWALVIVLVSFPFGAIAYLVAGRIPRQHRSPSAQPSVPPPTPQAQVRLPRRAVDPTDVVVATHRLRKVYGDHAALDDVDISVPRGVTYGLIGPNGAGKTTMLSILAGLRRPSSGTVELAVDRRSMGVLVDTPQFEPWLTAHEVVDLARHLTAPGMPRGRVADVLAEVGLGEAMHRQVGGFSRGMLQRLGLAGCLIGDPEVLLLDEPSSALDPAGRREVLDLVGRLAHTKTVILSTHILSDVQQVADVVAVIDQGRVRFQGPITDLLAGSSVAYSIHVRAGSEAVLADLGRQPWVEEALEQAPGRIRVHVTDAAAAERGIPRILAAHDVQLIAFNPATDLESAFLELTQGVSTGV